MWEIGEKLSFKRWISAICEKLVRSNLRKGHVWSTWLEAEESCQVVKFVSISWEGPSRKVPTKLSIWQKFKLLYQILYPHYKYPHYPRIVRSAFQRENPSKYTWELEIVITTIIYTPISPYLDLAQTLTTPILSVKWDFVTTGKHWKEPFSGRRNWAKL